MATRKTKTAAATAATPANLQFIDLGKIKTLPQVRTEFNDDSLAELAASLKQHGMLQPVLLRPQGQDFLVIAGERRIRAAGIAGLSAVPAIVGQADDETAATMQLIENIQREDLSLKDTAAGVLMLYEKHKALAPVAQIVQKSLSWVSKHLSVATKLSYNAQRLMEDGVTEDLELLMTVSQIENMPNAWPRGSELVGKIEEKKAGRKEARALLEQLRAEVEEAKKERKGKGKPGQGETTAAEDQRRQEPVWQPGNALYELHDVLADPLHPPVAELVKLYDVKQQAAMATVPQHVDAWHKGNGLAKAEKNGPAVTLRALANYLSREEISNDPFDLAAFILGSMDVKLTLTELATEVHHIMHG